MRKLEIVERQIAEALEMYKRKMGIGAPMDGDQTEQFGLFCQIVADEHQGNFGKGEHEEMMKHWESKN